MELKVEYVNISTIKPYKRNAKTHPKEQIEQIKKSIQEFGNCDPIGVWHGEIVEGHGRYLALKELGETTIPIIRLDSLTDEQRRAYGLVHNQLTMNSPWDLPALDLELADLDFDMGEFGFGLLDDDYTKPDEVKEDDFDEEPPADPKAKRGDIYKLGNHRLMCGDSTSAEDVAKLMDGAKADFVLSDPPYGMHLDTDFSDCVGRLKSLGKKNNTKGNKYNAVIGDNDDFTPELINTFWTNFDYVKEIFLFGADYYAELLPNKNAGSWLVWDKRKESQADAIGSEFELIWSKNKHKRRMLRFDWFGFLSSKDPKEARNRVHPTQKPTSLLAEIIKQWGDNANLIIDLFGGSGSTLIACEQLNRKCYMMELEPKYIDVIIARWEKFTGRKAEKI